MQSSQLISERTALAIFERWACVTDGSAYRDKGVSASTRKLPHVCLDPFLRIAGLNSRYSTAGDVEELEELLAISALAMVFT